MPFHDREVPDVRWAVMRGGVGAWRVRGLSALFALGCGSGGTADSRSEGKGSDAGTTESGGGSSGQGEGGGSGSSSMSTDSGGDRSDAGCPAGSAPACASGMICDRYGGPACVDPSWAEWPMPNAQVEVTKGAPNLESYTDNADGTVTDNVTELVWQQLTPPLNYTEPEALAYCTGLRLAGYTDWRLPSVVELVSIVDTGTYDPSIDSTFFPGTSAVGFYWSSTQFAGDVGSMWGVYFNNGYSDYNDASIAYSVRCVR